MAKVLVIGSGGREHAIAYKFKQSANVEEVFVAPGNPGMSDVATILPIAQNDYEKLIMFVKEKQIDLTFVGPEIPLCDGIADIFEKEGLQVFGPSKAAAKLEGSKVFCKEIMKKYNIPTAAYESFSDYHLAQEYLSKQEMPIVLKADGLAAGKGVIIALTMEEAQAALHEMMCNKLFSDAGLSVVIEEFLEGEEFSQLAFVNGDLVVPMQIAQDHKRAFDNDEGLNTGGMGAYTPVNHLPQVAIDDAIAQIMKPMAQAMVSEGTPFVGVLYGGCMWTKKGVKTIEFNVRFGDPETEVLLLSMEDDLYEVCMKVLNKEEVTLTWSDDAVIGVVLASEGYPENYTKGAVISGLSDVNTPVFHMGTAINDGQLVSNGGRVLFVTASAKTLKQAQEIVYQEAKKVNCDSLFYRNDIGSKGL